MTLDSKEIIDPWVRHAVIAAIAGVLRPQDFTHVVTALGNPKPLTLTPTP
jgi:hypothetical protein